MTETPGTMISRDAASMAVSRYEVVRRLAHGKRVLEVACGTGQGIGYVHQVAAQVVGGDLMMGLLAPASNYYARRAPFVCFDAHRLPFAPASFDVVQIHEAIYYMADPGLVFTECRRVLSAKGVLVISTINPEWSDFNPSPHAAGYLSASALKAALEREFSGVDIRFGFAVASAETASALLSMVKRMAVRFHLIPKTMKGKTLLKRLVFGSLVRVPPELPAGFAPIDEPIDAPLASSARFRVIYAMARS